VRRYKSTFLSASSFFGLQAKDKLYVYEEVFLLTRYCKIGFTDGWHMPISVRKWFIRRTSKENEDQAKEQEKQRKIAKANRK
tara:strand:- start:381 stop:626 length:246 start_codon:yes stop_codon:yes gene_type:complete